MYPRTSYIIYATPRSGSYLLCEALINTGLAGQPTEFFTPEQVQLYLDRYSIHWSDTAGYLDWVYTAGTTPNGVFGTKIIWQFFEDCLDLLRDIEGNEKLSVPDLLAKVFPYHQTMVTTRRDKVRQAISYWKALQTQAWLSFGEEAEKSKQEVAFSFQAIESLRKRIIHDEREMQHYFWARNIQPLIVVYEDLAKAYEETALQVLDYLNIPVPTNLAFGPRKMQKQSNAQTEEWLKRYYEIR